MSFDHIVGKCEQSVRNGEAERLGSLEIEHKFNLGWPNDRQVARLGAGEYASDVEAILMIGLAQRCCCNS